jgi:hypothetical protein
MHRHAPQTRTTDTHHRHAPQTRTADTHHRHAPQTRTTDTHHRHAPQTRTTDTHQIVIFYTRLLYLFRFTLFDSPNYSRNNTGFLCLGYSTPQYFR